MKEIDDIRKDVHSGITIAPAEDESNISHLFGFLFFDARVTRRINPLLLLAG
jgi:hypothetical protein